MAKQLDFFDDMARDIFTSSPRAPETVQEQELKRVTGNTAVWVLRYFAKLQTGQQFHMSELTSFVVEHVQCSPDSPRRVAADLKARGLVNFELRNRSQSLYEKL